MNAADGTLAAHYEYDPFGNTLVASGPEAGQNPFRFSTKYLDTETGLYYYGYRYYSPELGRWLTRDLVGKQGEINLYGFVNNGPIVNVDILGLWSQDVHQYKTLEWALSLGINHYGASGISYWTN